MFSPDVSEDRDGDPVPSHLSGAGAWWTFRNASACLLGLAVRRGLNPSHGPFC